MMWQEIQISLESASDGSRVTAEQVINIYQGKLQLVAGKNLVYLERSNSRDKQPKYEGRMKLKVISRKKDGCKPKSSRHYAVLFILTAITMNWRFSEFRKNRANPFECEGIPRNKNCAKLRMSRTVSIG